MVESNFRGISFIAWGQFLGIVLPALIGFALPFAIDDFNSDVIWLSTIYPLMGIVAFIGVVQVGLQASKILPLSRKWLCWLTILTSAVVVVLRWKSSPAMEPLAVVSGSLMFRALTGHLGLRRLSRSWLAFVLTYLTSSVLLYQISLRYIRARVLTSQAFWFEVATYLFFVVSVGVWGLMLLSHTRHALIKK